MLEDFRGRCKFRVYIENKATKYSIKIYSLVDVRTFYADIFVIYAGEQPKGTYIDDYSASSFVKRFASPILNNWRNIAMNNYSTSIPLGLKKEPQF